MLVAASMGSVFLPNHKVAYTFSWLQYCTSGSTSKVLGFQERWEEVILSEKQVVWTYSWACEVSIWCLEADIKVFHFLSKEVGGGGCVY